MNCTFHHDYLSRFVTCNSVGTKKSNIGISSNVKGQICLYEQKICTYNYLPKISKSTFCNILKKVFPSAKKAIFASPSLVLSPIRTYDKIVIFFFIQTLGTEAAMSTMIRLEKPWGGIEEMIFKLTFFMPRMIS